MARISQEEVDQITRKYLDLKKKADKDSSYEKEFKQYQNYCVERLQYLVHTRAARYKKFSNHPDLTQVGFVALILAFNSFDPGKSPFTWWAKRYIDTHISRAANAHSVIRFPIKKAKEMKPYKVKDIPVMIDWSADPFQETNMAEEKDKLTKLIKELPTQHRVVLNKTYGFSGEDPKSVKEVINDLDISRSQYVKILKEAKERIKQQFGEV